jgi:hypothetical protein
MPVPSGDWLNTSQKQFKIHAESVIHGPFVRELLIIEGDSSELVIEGDLNRVAKEVVKEVGRFGHAEVKFETQYGMYRLDEDGKVVNWIPLSWEAAHRPLTPQESKAGWFIGERDYFLSPVRSVDGKENVGG